MQMLWFMQGTYLLLEKLRHAVYRRLLRKVHAVHAVLEPEKRTQVPLAQFQAALAIQVCSSSSRTGVHGTVLAVPDLFALHATVGFAGSRDEPG